MGTVLLLTYLGVRCILLLEYTLDIEVLISMKFDKSLLSGSTQLLVLSIIAESDAYGYEIIL